jgi:hypothetical protein
MELKTQRWKKENFDNEIISKFENYKMQMLNIKNEL